MAYSNKGRKDLGSKVPQHDPESPDYVKPSNWCITKEDLDFFEKEVVDYWLAQKIPNNKEHPNPEHFNRAVGPTIHQVNEYYIKPRTLEAGGMSWAIMRNPKGLECDVFATHCWQEGVFEFINKVRNIWPSDAKHLYVCFLANPQNGGMVTEILTNDVSESPFAKALEKARYMIVIPNMFVSIYTRLWCVYEARLALEATASRGLSIRLPWVEDWSQVAKMTLPALLPPFIGIFMGYIHLAPLYGDKMGPVMWMVSTYTVTGLTSAVLQQTIHLALSPRLAVNFMFVLAYLEILFVGMGAGLAWHHLDQWAMAIGHRDSGKFNLKHFAPGETTACALVLVSLILLCLFKILTGLIQQCVEKAKAELGAVSVREACCSNAGDQERILRAIEGHEDNIDQALEMLKTIGRYDFGVRRNLEWGMTKAHARAGCDPFKVTTAVFLWQFWWITDLGGDHHHVTACMLPLSTLVLAFAAIRKYGERCICAIDLALVFGIIFLLASNHPFFFNPESLSCMTLSSLWLQLGTFVAMIIADLCFYKGLWVKIAGNSDVASSGNFLPPGSMPSSPRTPSGSPRSLFTDIDSRAESEVSQLLPLEGSSCLPCCRLKGREIEHVEGASPFQRMHDVIMPQSSGAFRPLAEADTGETRIYPSI